MVVPGFILVCEFACPFSLSPWVSNSDELQAIDLSDLLDSISMIEENSSVAHAFFGVAVFILDGVGTA